MQSWAQPSFNGPRPEIGSIKARRQRSRCRSSAAAGASQPAQGNSNFGALLNASLVSGSLSLAGDVVAQVLAAKQRSRGGSLLEGLEYDITRGARMASFGLLLYGPGQLVWYRFLDRRFAAKTLQNFIAKVVANQVVLAPVVISSVFAWTLALQRQLDAWPAKMRADFRPTLIRGWKFWIPAASVNFAVVPVEYQVLYMSVCSVVWTAILSSSSSSTAGASTPAARAARLQQSLKRKPASA